MASSLIDSKYFCDMFGTEEMRNVFSDERRIEAWLKTEVALAKAQAKVGVFPKKVAEKIAEAAQLKNIDVEAMKVEFDKVGFPILPFVHQLTKVCDAETARWVHYGATTQDVLDTGMVLQIRKGMIVIERDIFDICEALSVLCKTHRNTVMAGRTFQQLAAPITFGYKAAVWLDEMGRHIQRLTEIKNRVFVGQCAGAVGTFATLSNKGLEVQKEMMKELGLKVPDITWHNARDGWSELIGFFALMGSTLAKIANEVAILMRSEIGEISEPFEIGRGASTTLPQKRNPISCEPIIANSHRIREMASSQMMAMMQEHERGVGQMHIEWMVVPEAFILTAGALKHAKFILENLWVDPQKMRENLDLGGGILMSEAVMMGLAPIVGKSTAHHLVYAAAGRAIDQGKTLKEELLKDENIRKHISSDELDVLINPANYLGSAPEMTDKVLEKWEQVKQDNKQN